MIPHALYLYTIPMASSLNLIWQQASYYVRARNKHGGAAPGTVAGQNQMRKEFVLRWKTVTVNASLDKHKVQF